MAVGNTVSTVSGAQSIAAARELAPHIAARSDEIEQARRLPEVLVRALRNARFFRMFLPRAYGGGEVDPLTALTVTEVLSQADGSVGWCIRTGIAASYWNFRLDPAAAAEMYGPDSSIVMAGGVQVGGEAVVVDGGYWVSGRWPLASGCTHSAWLPGICRVTEGGEPRLLPTGQPELRTVFFPAAQVTILDTWYTTGLRGTGSHDIEVREVVVPERWTHVVGQQAPAAPRPGPLHRVLPLLFPVEGAFALGVAQHALDAFVELAAVKAPHGAAQLVREQPGMQETAARAHARIQAARSWLVQSTTTLWAAASAGGEGTPLQRADVRLATAHAMRSAVEAVDLLQEAAGTSAIYTRSPIERCFRDLHTAQADFVVGPLAYRAAGRVVLGSPADNPSF